jgi:hypothetical protein
MGETPYGHTLPVLAPAPGASAGMASKSALRGPLNTDSSRPPGRFPQEEHA